MVGDAHDLPVPFGAVLRPRATGARGGEPDLTVPHRCDAAPEYHRAITSSGPDSQGMSERDRKPLRFSFWMPLGSLPCGDAFGKGEDALEILDLDRAAPEAVNGALA